MIKVICINDYLNNAVVQAYENVKILLKLKKGCIYTTENFSTRYISIYLDGKFLGFFDINNFQLLSEFREERINKIIG